MTGGPSGLAAFASLLLPSSGGRFVPAPDDWRPPRELDLEADVVLWGAPPRGSGVAAAPASAVARALRREAALVALRVRPPRGWRLKSVHRLAAAQTRRDRIGQAVRSALGSGALVELRGTGRPPSASRLDEVLRAAGVDGPAGRRGWHLGPGGSLLGFVRRPNGVRAVLRATAGDGRAIANGAAGLRAVRELELAPRLLDEGRTADVAWSLESAVSGRPPSGLTPELVAQVASRWTRLPGTSDGPARALEEDLREAALHLPGRSDELLALADRLPDHATPSGLRHGDLWSGNLLVDDQGRFVAAVDWDHYHPAAVPGTDLLQLLATDRRHATRRSLGAAVLARPWREPEVATHLPTDVDPELVGLAWWATEVAGTLQRDPARADDPAWTETNVDDVLRAWRV